MDFNIALNRSLRHIEGFFFSSVIVHLYRDGILECFRNGLSIVEIARKKQVDECVLRGLLGFLEAEGVIEGDNKRTALTDYGNLLFQQIGWFNLLVGGYSPTLRGLDRVLREGKIAGERDERSIVLGSGLIDHYDVVPTAKRAIEKWAIPTNRFIDLGCGTATCLVELCTAFGSIECVGVAGGSDVAADARQLVSASGLTGKIHIEPGDATEYHADTEPDFFLAAFVLQEIAFQKGIEGLICFLRRLREQNPNAWILVFEVPDVPWSKSELATEAGKYYRCYFLVHHLTRQHLLTSGEWEDVFLRGGYDLISTEFVDTPYDPTKMEVCFVLRPQT